MFKSWFVDFEPFGGTMPGDWKIGKLKDVLKLKKTPIRAGENCALPYLPIDIIPIHSLALTEFRPNSEAQSSLITFDKDDILIGAMRVYFHRVTIAPCAGITRTTCFVLSPFDESYLLYALLLCNQDKSIEFAQTTSKGSTMPYAVWDGGLGDLEINIPQRNIVEKFNNILLPSIRQIQNSYFENTRLAAIRDALLPKLMSGEIDVSKVNISADKLSFIIIDMLYFYNKIFLEIVDNVSLNISTQSSGHSIIIFSMCISRKIYINPQCFLLEYFFHFHLSESYQNILHQNPFHKSTNQECLYHCK